VSRDIYEQKRLEKYMFFIELKVSHHTEGGSLDNVIKCHMGEGGGP